MYNLSEQVPKINHNIQLVFFDVDGTLLNTNGNYSQRLVDEIQRLHCLGIKTAIASGRPSYAARFLFDEVGIADVGVFCTGAEIYAPKEKKHLQVHPLNNDIAFAIYQRAKECGVYCEIYTPDKHYVDVEDDISRIHGQHLRVQPFIQNGSDIFSSSPSVIKLLLGQDVRNNSPMLRILETEFSTVEFAFAHFLARPDWEFASVISHVANKESAFDQVLKHYNLPASAVMAMGDSHSDMIFIQRAGVGVAMGNASEEVRSVADYVTLAADDDGAAFALAALIP